jgi:radical SAM superfamily enzyme YgiQ (UPF0313 family)
LKVILINAPYLDVYGSINVGENYAFALGIGYIAAVLKRRGHDVRILEPEAAHMTREQVAEYLRIEDPDVVGITCATANFNGARMLMELVKRSVGAVTVLGGVHASALPVQTLRDCPQFDYIVVGEGEYAMVELLEALDASRSDLSAIKGLAWRREGRIVVNEPRSLIADLDELPFPARELVDLSHYRPQVHLDLGLPSATMITSRGCPNRCTFCASEVTLGHPFRAHSPAYVLREIEHLVDTYGIRHVIFVDDTFTMHKKRCAEICRRIIARGLDIKWYCFARVNTMDEDLLKLMRRAGCYSVLFGVESADQRILKEMKKGITVEQARKAIRLANRAGLKTLASFIFGSPGETHETIEKTIRFALETNPTIASFNRMVPYPGTELYRTAYVPRYGEVADWNQFVPKADDVIEITEHLSAADIQRATVEAFRRFYLRPRQMMRVMSNVRSFAEFRAYARGALGLFRKARVWLSRARSGKAMTNDQAPMTSQTPMSK